MSLSDRERSGAFTLFYTVTLDLLSERYRSMGSVQRSNQTPPSGTAPSSATFWAYSSTTMSPIMPTPTCGMQT